MTRPEPGPPSQGTREEILADIERTRDRLSATTDELASKFAFRLQAESAAQSAGTALSRAVEPVTRTIDGRPLRRYGPVAAAAMTLMVAIALRKSATRRRH